MEGFTFTPQLGVIIGLLIGMLIGWAIGFFDSNNRSEKKIKEAQDQAKQVEEEARKLVAKAKEEAASAIPLVADDPGLLRLKIQNGRYDLEVDGAPVQTPLRPEARKRLIDLLTVIRPYLEGTAPPPAPQQMSATPKPAAPRPAPMVDSLPPAFLQPKEEVKPIPASPFNLPPKKEEEPVPFASLSMVMQIDSVLQEQLLNGPLAGRGIRLTESPQGGVEVFVGNHKFDTVDDVPYEEVKSAIRAAIAAWEKKVYPGG